MSELLYQTLRGINRNIVECKGIRHISHIPGSIGINRNIVECKVGLTSGFNATDDMY